MLLLCSKSRRDWFVQGEGVAYRGRVLVELQTIVGEKPKKLVDDILKEDLTRVEVPAVYFYYTFIQHMYNDAEALQLVYCQSRLVCGQTRTRMFQCTRATQLNMNFLYYYFDFAECCKYNVAILPSAASRLRCCCHASVYLSRQSLCS